MKRRRRRKRRTGEAKIEYRVSEEESGVSFHDPIEEYASIELPDGAGSVEYQCPMEYDPDQEYTREELIGLIKVHRELLCFFAQMSGYRRCVLGVALDEYDEASGCVPVYVINRQGAKVLMQAEGRKFAQAYRSSEAGKNLMVTFTSRQMTGWFKMRWQAPQHMFVTYPEA